MKKLKPLEKPWAYSLSRLKTFRMCAHKGYHQYVRGIRPDDTSTKLNFGKAIDVAIEHAFIQYMDTKRLPNPDELKQVMMDSWHGVYGDKLSKWEKDVHAKANMLEPTFQAAYQTVFFPLKDLVRSVQAKVKFDVKGREVLGYIDIELNDDYTLIDLKTTWGRRWERGRENREYQAPLYSTYLFSRLPDLKSVSFQYHILTISSNPNYNPALTKEEREAVQIHRFPQGAVLFEKRERIVTREEAELFAQNFVYNEIERVEDMRERFNQCGDPAVFPGNPEAFFCSKKYCAFWAECESTFGWRIKD